MLRRYIVIEKLTIVHESYYGIRLQINENVTESYR